jgi:hypothetical protein
MLRVLARTYFWPGQTGWTHYKTHILRKQAKFDAKKFYDPLDESQLPLPDMDRSLYPHEVFVFVDRIMKKRPEKITTQPLSYIMYHASRHNLHSPALWQVLEDNLQSQQQHLDTRMLFGCLYGIFRSSQGSLIAVESLQHDFTEQALDKIDAKESHELVEAAFLNTREDYSAGDYVVEYVMPRAMHFWEKSEHSCKQLSNFTNALVKFELFDPKVWQQVLGTFLKKELKTAEYWAPLYEALVLARNSGMERLSGVSLEEALGHFRRQYEEHVDIQWKYDINGLKFYNIHEMIARADQGPAQLTWEIAEDSIRHKLPKWYFDMDIEMDDDVRGLYFEYKEILEKQQTKRSK